MIPYLNGASFRIRVSSLNAPPAMDLDLRTVLRWLIYGVLILIGLSLLGVLVDVAATLLQLILKAGVVVLIVLLILRLFEGLRS
jgi:hypothetical protein